MAKSLPATHLFSAEDDPPSEHWVSTRTSFQGHSSHDASLSCREVVKLPIVESLKELAGVPEPALQGVKALISDLHRGFNEQGKLWDEIANMRRHLDGIDKSLQDSLISDLCASETEEEETEGCKGVSKKMGATPRAEKKEIVIQPHSLSPPTRPRLGGEIDSTILATLRREVDTAREEAAQALQESLRGTRSVDRLGSILEASAEEVQAVKRQLMISTADQVQGVKNQLQSTMTEQLQALKCQVQSEVLHESQLIRARLEVVSGSNGRNNTASHDRSAIQDLRSELADTSEKWTLQAESMRVLGGNLQREISDIKEKLAAESPRRMSDHGTRSELTGCTRSDINDVMSVETPTSTARLSQDCKRPVGDKGCPVDFENWSSESPIASRIEALEQAVAAGVERASSLSDRIQTVEETCRQLSDGRQSESFAAEEEVSCESSDKRGAGGFEEVPLESTVGTIPDAVTKRRVPQAPRTSPLRRVSTEAPRRTAATSPRPRSPKISGSANVVLSSATRTAVRRSVSATMPGSVSAPQGDRRVVGSPRRDCQRTSVSTGPGHSVDGITRSGRGGSPQQSTRTTGRESLLQRHCSPPGSSVMPDAAPRDVGSPRPGPKKNRETRAGASVAGMSAEVPSAPPGQESVWRSSRDCSSPLRNSVQSCGSSGQLCGISMLIASSDTVAPENSWATPPRRRVSEESPGTQRGSSSHEVVATTQIRRVSCTSPTPSARRVHVCTSSPILNGGPASLVLPHHGSLTACVARPPPPVPESTVGDPGTPASPHLWSAAKNAQAESARRASLRPAPVWPRAVSNVSRKGVNRWSSG